MVSPSEQLGRPSRREQPHFDRPRRERRLDVQPVEQGFDRCPSSPGNRGRRRGQMRVGSSGSALPRRGQGRRWRSRRARRRTGRAFRCAARAASRLGTRLCRRPISRLRLEWSTRSGAVRRHRAATGAARPIVDQAEGHRFVKAGARQDWRTADSTRSRSAPRGHSSKRPAGLRGYDGSRESARPPRSSRSRARGRSARKGAATVERASVLRDRLRAPATVKIRTTFARSIVDAEDALDLAQPQRDRRPLRRPGSPRSITPG